MAEATLYKDSGTNAQDVTAPAALDCGEIIQLSNGKAGVTSGLLGIPSGDKATLEVTRQYAVTKIATKAVLEGGRLWWDRSSSHATPIRTADCFFLGTAVKDAATTETTCVVDLNAKPEYQIDLREGEWTETLTNGLGVVNLAGGSQVQLAMDNTSEAAMAALQSADTVPVADGPILEAQVAIYDIGTSVVDFSVGLANDTHADDFDGVTEAVIFHWDGGDLTIFAESDDGTTEVAAVTTEVDAVDDTYVELWIDARDLTHVKIYIDGVNVLAATEFKLDAATGPMLAIAHIEKTSSTETADLRLRHMTVRTTDLAAA